MQRVNQILDLKKIEAIVLHTYFNRILIFLAFLTLFLWLFTFIPFYPLGYALILSLGISTLATRNRRLALILGFILVFPSVLYQNAEFSAFFFILFLLWLPIAVKDWKTAFLALFSFLCAFSPLFFLTPITILIVGFVFGQQRGALIGLVSSLMITAFGLGLGMTSAGFIIFPVNLKPFLTPWFNEPTNFIAAMFNIQYDNIRPVLPTVNLVFENPFLVTEIIAMSFGGYLSGNALTWRINNRERYAMVVGAIPIIVMHIISTIISGQSYSNIGFAFFTLFFIALMSYTSNFWRPLIFRISAIRVTDLRMSLPSKDNEIEKLRIENQNRLLTKDSEIERLRLDIKDKDGLIKTLNFRAKELEKGIEEFRKKAAQPATTNVKEFNLTISQKTILWLIFKNTNSREGIEDKMGIPESSLDESLQLLTKFGLIEMQQQNFFLTPTGYVIAVRTPEEIRKLGQ